MSSLRHSAAKSLVWTLTESVGLSGVSLITLIAFARMLSPTEMGVGTIALGMVQLLTVPVEVLFQDALIQRDEVEQAHFDTAFTVSLALGLALVLLGWACSGLLAWFVGIAELGPVFAIMNLSLIPMSFATVVAARQRREMDFRSLALRSLVGRLSGAAVGVGVAMLGGGVWALVVQQVLLVGLAAVVLWVLASHRPRLRFSRRHLRDLIGFGLRSVAVMFANVAVQRVYMVLVGAWLGAAAAGYINLAFRAIDMLRDVVAGSVVQLALPLFGRFKGDAEGLRRVYAEATSFTCMIGFPIFAGLTVSAPEVVALLFGPQWTPAVPYVALFGLLVLPYFVRLYLTPCMAASGRPQAALPGLFVNLAFVVIGMATLGRISLEWAAVIWAVRLLASMPVDAMMLKRVSGINYRTQFFGAGYPFFAALAMLAAVFSERAFLLQPLALLTRIVAMVSLGAAVYGALMIVLDRATVMRVVSFARGAISRQGANVAAGTTVPREGQ